jgi:hypothetical protein
MKPLTFKGFLKQYVQELSGQSTLNVFRLAEAAEQENPRLREPLTLYALFHNKTHVLRRGAKGNWLDHEVLLLKPEKVMELLEHDSEALPANYRKIYRSYCSVAGKKQSDDHTKELLRRRTRQLQTEHRISNYRLYRDLELNAGNINAYLKHGDAGKVSLETARRLFEQAKERSRHNNSSVLP